MGKPDQGHVPGNLWSPVCHWLPTLISRTMKLEAAFLGARRTYRWCPAGGTCHMVRKCRLQGAFTHPFAQYDPDEDSTELPEFCWGSAQLSEPRAIIVTMHVPDLVLKVCLQYGPEGMSSLPELYRDGSDVITPLTSGPSSQPCLGGRVEPSGRAVTADVLALEGSTCLRP